jgi:serine/threonine protein kinase
MTQHAASVDFAKLQEIFLAAVERHRPEEWDAFLAQACTDDDELYRQVNVLLKAHREAGSVPGAPSRDRDAAGAHEIAAERPGMVIGLYKLLEQIGEGGMGTVWTAQQEVPVKRVVAVKLIKAGMDSKQVLARFEAERQALALMDHPNIAKVLDGGATSRPYFVMDLVKGVPITKYCDDYNFTPRQRLELFVPVCQAIQHAHQKGIIHRDIKPSNVLVAMYDDQPAPKVIDFGVAKATGRPLTEETLHTGFGVVVGTVEYMSPEQASLNQLDVDTRSDIYSLGVLLYELLTGTTPLEHNRVEKSGILEALRIIREEDAPTLSNRLATTAELPAIAAKRGLEPRKLAKLVRGELDWIVIKTLEKDRNRRYATANALAMDLQRYLADESVQACPPSMTYRLRKFVRRNKAWVVGSLALAMSLMVGVGVITAMQAKADRERATREAWTSASVAAATREARERVDEAWNLFEYPDQMQRATDAAFADIHRADEFAAGGMLTEQTHEDLVSAHQAVDELSRHTRLITAIESNAHKYADEHGGDQNQYKAGVHLSASSRQAMKEFGLDPIEDERDRTVQAIANSRIRDALLGMLLGWQSAAAELARMRKALPQRPEFSADAVKVSDRLDLVVRATRQQCGGPYARWQDLLDRKDVPGLVAFASSTDALSFRSSLVNALGNDLFRIREFQASQKLLRNAVDRYPHDVWLHFGLSQACFYSQPIKGAEALRHLASASVQRPESALFLKELANCYALFREYDLAIASYRKAIAFDPNSAQTYTRLAALLQQTKDWDGLVAARRQAVRLEPNEMQLHVSLRSALAAAGRHAEAAEVLTAIRRNTVWATQPQTNVRYVAAYDAMRTANGRFANVPLPADRPSFRKQALDQLTAELVFMRMRPAADRAMVHASMKYWLEDGEFASVRDSNVANLPEDERDPWSKLWADVLELCERTAPKAWPAKSGK